MNHPLPQRLSASITKLREELDQAGVIVFDFETSGLDTHRDQIAGLGIYTPKTRRAFYINVGHNTRDPNFPKASLDELKDAITPFFGDPERLAIAHNATYDLQLIIRVGIPIKCDVSCTMIQTHRTDENLRSWGDTPTYHHNVETVGYGLKKLTTIYFNIKPPEIMDVTGGINIISCPIAPVAKYCIADVVNTYNLYERNSRLISRDPKLKQLIDEIDNKNLVPLTRMIYAGIPVDVDEARRQKGIYDKSIQRCREEIWKATGLDWGLDTPGKRTAILRQFDLDIDYDPFFEPIDGIKPSINLEVLERVFEESNKQTARKVIALILSKSLMEQRISAFLNVLPEKTRYSYGRLYVDRFSSTLATTRFSTTPNVQNFPSKADSSKADDPLLTIIPEDCREHQSTKNIIAAPEGRTLISADLSAAEPRYLSLLFQRFAKEGDKYYQEKLKEIRKIRRLRYPQLIELKWQLQDKSNIKPAWTSPAHGEDDQLWQVFKQGGDPYNALLKTIDPTGYEQAKREGEGDSWLKENRWRGKRAFLALAYGSQAETLAPGLKWSVERTTEAIDALNRQYVNLSPLIELIKREVIHLGGVITGSRIF